MDAGTDAGECIPGAGSDLQTSRTYAARAFNSAASGDLNGDGVLDLVASGGYEIQVFFGDGDGGLSAGITLPTAGWGTAEIGDVNGDGAPDIVVASVNGIVVFLNDGGGGFVASGRYSKTSDAGWNEVRAIAIGNFTTDGGRDLVIDVGNLTGWNLWVFSNVDGGFQDPVQLQGLSGLGGMIVADLNMDGLADLVADTADEHNLAVLINLGDGGFSQTSYPAPATGGLITIPGSNGPDLLVGDYGGGPSSGDPSVFQVVRNDGHGGFQVGPRIPVPGAFYLATADFNGDCIPDVVAVSFQNGYPCDQIESTLFVLYGQSDGGFTPPEFLDAGGTRPVGTALLGSARSPRDLAVVNQCMGGGIQVFGSW